MQIRRAVETADYVQVANTVARDRRLSFRARGVLLYLLSLPPAASCDSNTIAEDGTEGRDAIRTALGELQACGYLARRRVRGILGRWTHEMTIFSRPQPVSVANMQVGPTTDYQASADQASADQALEDQYGLSNTDPPTPADAGEQWQPCEHGPKCNRRICGNDSRSRARRARLARPPWCGECDERTRLRDRDGDTPSRCRECHPLSPLSTRSA